MKHDAAQSAENELLKETSKVQMTREDFDKRWGDAWRSHLRGEINLCETNLGWWTSEEGKQHSRQVDVKKETNKMEYLRKRFVDAEREPRTALEAVIKPR